VLRVSRRLLVAERGDGGEGRGGCRWEDGVPRPQRPIRGFARVDEIRGKFVFFPALGVRICGGKGFFVLMQRKAQIKPVELIDFLNHKRA